MGARENLEFYLESFKRTIRMANRQNKMLMDEQKDKVRVNLNRIVGCFLVLLGLVLAAAYFINDMLPSLIIGLFMLIGGTYLLIPEKKKEVSE